ILGAAETAARVGSAAYAGSLFDVRAGTVQPLAYVRGLARAAIAAGARVFGASPALGCERAGGGGPGGAWRVSAPGGSVTADWVIVATNAYATAPWPEVRGELVRLPYFNFATAPLGHNARATVLPGREGAWDTRRVLSSFRTDRAGRLVVGSVGGLEGAGAGIHGAWARRVLRRLFPQAGDAPFEAGWYGHIGMTADALPRFHRLAPNVVGFSGYNGRGIGPGTALGRVLAEHILGTLREADLPLPTTDPRPALFRHAREAAYEAGARLAHAVGARGV
ncbi:MAG: FAD-binding oxidoreductase, partial [Acetobacteraceae bacterium]|nr:FAD-binding oxidoreductase [Acetobacteraceae bacterium]